MVWWCLSDAVFATACYMCCVQSNGFGFVLAEPQCRDKQIQRGETRSAKWNAMTKSERKYNKIKMKLQQSAVWGDLCLFHWNWLTFVVGVCV